MGTTSIDEKGRIVLPKDLRDRYGLTPGARVSVEATRDGIAIRPALSMQEALARLRAAIPPSGRRRRVTSDELKSIWEPKL